ncbi:MAG: glucose-6-phosphate dehydrogenase [Candidatus Latescibacterota bacterium]|jgi:glucose-6-phosphate 1-dehydrogenase
MKSIRRPDPTAIVIFGGSGDLTWRKLVPALFDLYLDEWLPDLFAIIGLDIKEFTQSKYREHLLDGVKKFARHSKVDAKVWKEFASRISYQKTDFTERKGYEALTANLAKMNDEWKITPCTVYYMAVPPRFIEPIANLLRDFKLATTAKNARIVIEKPFGRDYASASELNNLLGGCFSEKSIYRIDHYLGKETVQNIIAFRFANALFEPLWNRNYVDHVQVTVSENVGVEHRGGYYENAGALRDMVQNHLIQLLCLVAMEAPVRFTADEIRNRKVDVLHAIRKLRRDEVHQYAIRGQYGPGWIEGKNVVGYREEPGVEKDSGTETFAALKLFIDNWRWQGVPFYLRTGKRMQETLSVIAIQFRPVPHQAFPMEAVEDWRPNRLIIAVQPQKGIRLQFQAKRPGQTMILNAVDMVFNYSDAYDHEPPEAYETLLLDVMLGDATLFMRRDQIEEAWNVIDPILQVWGDTTPPDFPDYAAGRWGPEEAEALIARDGHNWVSVAMPEPKPVSETDK